jgi:GH24 family phage-related lysozyme (muramidase)
MTITVNPTPASGNFTDFLYNFIRPLEGFVPRIYTDSVGVPTLGVGYAPTTGDGAKLDLPCKQMRSNSIDTR